MAQSNEDRLKVPAFLRKSGIRKKASKPLLLTALDRKRAGVKVGDTRKKRKRASVVRSKSSVRRSAAGRRSCSRTAVAATASVFDEPLFGDVLTDHEFADDPAVPVFDDGMQLSYVGRMTHYFDGICVGVIDLEAPVRAGEYILFEIDGGLCGQRVTSMQYNKRDISLGKTGMEVGLKLTVAPSVGGKVYKM